MRIENEFAAVEVELDTRGNDARLKVEDCATGMTVYLDPLELQGLAWARHDDLAAFTNPIFREDAVDRMEEEEHLREVQDLLRSAKNDK